MSGIVGTSSAKSKVIGRSQDTAKAWVHMSSSSATVEQSYNCSSCTRNAEGVYTANFNTGAVLDASYAIAASAQRGSEYLHAERYTTGMSASGCTFILRNSNDTVFDPDEFTVIVFGV